MLRTLPNDPPLLADPGRLSPFRLPPALPSGVEPVGRRRPLSSHACAMPSSGAWLDRALSSSSMTRVTSRTCRHTGRGGAQGHTGQGGSQGGGPYGAPVSYQETQPPVKTNRRADYKAGWLAGWYHTCRIDIMMCHVLGANTNNNNKRHLTHSRIPGFRTPTVPTWAHLCGRLNQCTTASAEV